VTTKSNSVTRQSAKLNHSFSCRVRSDQRFHGDGPQSSFHTAWFLTGSAFAETPAGFLDSQESVLPPPVVDLAQAGVDQTTRASGSYANGAALGFDFGNGFKTEIEGASARAVENPFGTLPTSASIRVTSLMLNGLRVFTDGAWRIRPYIGAGLGMVDANARILGATRNDWITAYRLRGGVSLGFTQKLMGSLEYRWTVGSTPHFALAGIPTKLEIDRHGVVLGVNYKY
jgi:opacity protein-like surface antigen